MLLCTQDEHDYHRINTQAGLTLLLLNAPSPPAHHSPGSSPPGPPSSPFLWLTFVFREKVVGQLYCLLVPEIPVELQEHDGLKQDRRH